VARIALVHADVVAAGREPALFQRPVFRLAHDLSALGHEVSTLAVAPATGSQAGGGARATTLRGFDVVHGIGVAAGRVLEESSPPCAWAWSSEVGEGEWWPTTARLLVVPTRHDHARFTRAAAPVGALRIVAERLASRVSHAGGRGDRGCGRTAVTVLGDVGAVADAVRTLTLVPELRLTVLTDRNDPHRSSARPIELLARRLGVERRVRWWRPVDADDARRTIAEADTLLVLSATFDPSLVAAGMSVGTPVLMADVAGAAEFSCAGSTAVVVGTGDPRRLATVLRIMLADHRTQDDMTEAARRFVREELDPWVTSTRLVNLYAEFIDGVRPLSSHRPKPRGTGLYGRPH
jgi:hypothetical protein